MKGEQDTCANDVCMIHPAMRLMNESNNRTSERFFFFSFSSSHFDELDPAIVHTGQNSSQQMDF